MPTITTRVYRFRTTTFGCKVNQYESRQIDELLERLGLELAPADDGDNQPVDLHIINTCVVTGEAARQCRQMIRRLRRQSAEARVVVTGCYATGPEAAELAEIDGIDLVLGDKQELLARLGDLVMQWFRPADASCACGRKRAIISAAPADGGLQHFAGHARGFVKIQDGCSQFCTYCIVPHVRPKLWSRPPADVAAEVRRLVRGGQQEIVLSGIHLGRYRHELGDVDALPRLLEELLRLPEKMRLRLSSIEAGEVTEQLLELMAANPERICGHLHIPLQSGDDQVLAAMHRPYDSAEFMRRVDHIRSHLPEVALTTDVIVGFPGESEAAFENTVALVERAGFSRLNVFPFSSRKGTPAAEMSEQIGPQTRQARAARLRTIGEELARAYARQFQGRRVSVLIEKLRRSTLSEAERGVQRVATGLAEHYLRVEAEIMSNHHNHVARGQLLPVQIDRWANDQLRGRGV